MPLLFPTFHSLISRGKTPKKVTDVIRKISIRRIKSRFTNEAKTDHRSSRNLDSYAHARSFRKFTAKIPFFGILGPPEMVNPPRALWIYKLLLFLLLFSYTIRKILNFKSGFGNVPSSFLSLLSSGVAPLSTNVRLRENSKATRQKISINDKVSNVSEIHNKFIIVMYLCFPFWDMLWGYLWKSRGREREKYCND